MTELTLTRPDDWHLHLRDGEAMQSVLPHSARQFARAIVMPNLKPPVTTVAAAAAYRERILAALPEGAHFEPLMTLYLTDNTRPAEIRAARESGFVHAVKYYPAGATTHSDAGVTDMHKAYPAIAAMEEHGLPLLLHGEVTDPEIDVFDRESVFIERYLGRLMHDFPGLKIVLDTSPPGAPPSSWRARRPPWPPPSPPITCYSTATPCSRAASVRTTTVCRC